MRSQRPRPSPRHRLGTLLASLLMLVPLAACKDDRGDPVGPDRGPLTPETLYGSALVSVEIFRMINHFAERTLEIYENAIPLPVFENSCLGEGRATITNNNDTIATTFGVTFSAYVIDCAAFPLTISTDSTVAARMTIHFRETSPGLVYEVSLPLVGSDPRGINVQLPTDAGGFILETTTEHGPLRYELSGTRDDGTIHVSGYLRLEDRSQGLLLVEDLALEYGYADTLFPKYDWFPGGSYEIAGIGGGFGGFGFGGAVPGFPTDVFFDGLGGAAFPAEDRTCIVNLATGENPCEGL